MYRDTRKHKKHIAKMGIEIDYSYQNRGIGQILMKEIVKFAKQAWKDLELIEVSISGSNKQSIRAHEKFGFKHVAAVPNAIKWKGKYYSEMIMQYRIR